MRGLRIILAALGAGLLACGPVAAQTDDRIINDVFTVLRGETLLARTSQLCREMAQTDIEADFADWTERNAAMLRLAEQLMDTRPGFDMRAYVDMRIEAASEAGRTFARERDWPAYCERLGETMATGKVDLASWFPRETTRIAEAAEGKWPPLELEGVPAIAEAIAVKQLFFSTQDSFVRCGVLFPPAAPYEAAASEWKARNAYTFELADRVLENWGALHSRRWADARDAAGAEVDATFADRERAAALCRANAGRVETGELDIDHLRPDLFESVLANAEIVP